MVNREMEKKPVRGSIRKHRGPWLVRRATKNGTVNSLRFPSENEREKNKMRERKRRKITSNIYSGLRAHGGYNLPRNCDNNLVLIKLCEEAGWLVEEDGTISRKDLKANGVADCDEKDVKNCGVYGDNNVDLALSL